MATMTLGHTAISIQQNANSEVQMSSFQSNNFQSKNKTHDVPHVHPPTKSKHFDTKAKRQLGMRSWMKVDSSGEIQFVLLDKYKVVHEYGVQLRDLRILDPNLATTYPSAILCREKALIVNIEHIRLIITPESVMVRNAEDAPVTQFVEVLKQKLSQPATSYPALSGLNGGPSANPALNQLLSIKEDEKGVAGGAQDLRIFAPQFPFELRALEACLEQVALMLDADTSQLEAAAHHALENLTKKVTAHNLERVRKIKTRMVRLSTKVETIREVLEKLLDDDKDMLSMNLTAKTQLMGGSPLAPFETAKDSVSSVSSDSEYEEDEIAKVEMLLEPYFMQVDNTYNKLQSLKEYIDDTEDLINIKLDQHRNRLIGIDLLFTAAMFALSLITAVTGIFGMNLKNTHEDSYKAFRVVAAGSSGLAITLFLAFVFISYRKKLLNFW